MKTGTYTAAEDLVQRASDREEADLLVRRMRRAAKRRKRQMAWILPMIAVGMTATVLIFSRLDMRLSLAVFGVTAAMVAFALSQEAGRWGQMADHAVALGDVRAIGPLLAVLNDRDSSAGCAIEEALIELLPKVKRLSQLSRATRRELNRMLLEFEMPGFRGGHNAELARTALELVDRFRDCSALPAVRRLADGFTATRPAAAIRDLAIDMLPDLEVRAALLRPASNSPDPATSYLRPVATASGRFSTDQLMRAIVASANKSDAEPANEQKLALCQSDGSSPK
jgi:hypothetical protein